jgi:hypothetical protein
VIHAIHPLGLGLGLGQGRQQHGRQNGDDGDHHLSDLFRPSELSIRPPTVIDGSGSAFLQRKSCAAERSWMSNSCALAGPALGPPTAEHEESRPSGGQKPVGTFRALGQATQYWSPAWGGQTTLNK